MDLTSIDALNRWGEGKLPGLIGVVFVDMAPGRISCMLDVRPDHLAPNGYLHAGAVVSLADSACGYGVMTNLPAGAHGFTTVELKTNFLGTVLEGRIICEAQMIHSGRTTQVWDATVSDAASGKVLALFRCTQMLLYPRE
jgi:1,4-dihydroxy-2-naphthoyl-CoA hydrolase